MSKKNIVDRRRFLRGLLSTAIHLPILDIMLNSHGEAFAQGLNLPKNYFSVFSGLSQGCDSSQVSKAIMQPDNTSTAPLTDLRTALQPLDDFGVKNLVQVISNLKMPKGQNIPGGLEDTHGASIKVQLSGFRKNLYPQSRFNSPDVLFSNNYYNGKIPLTLGVQFSPYRDSGWDSTISWKDGNKLQDRKNFHQEYLNLTSARPSADGQVEKQRMLQLQKRGTVLDLVKDDLVRFQKKLGSADKIKLDRHLSSIRDIEKNLKSHMEGTNEPSQSCAAPTDENRFKSMQGGGYSNEIQRAKLAVELAHMAISCGVNNTVNIMGSYQESFMNSEPFIGRKLSKGTLHHLTHRAGEKWDGKPHDHAISLVKAWHVGIFSDLVKKLKDTQVGNKTLYDNTVGVFYCETGVGNNYYNHGSGSNFSHSGENMVMMVSGNMNGLRPGYHVNANEQHPTKVFLSVLRALGMTNNTQGDVSGIINQMFA